MTAIIREVTIGPCRLIQGDCLEVLPLLGKVDAVVTDPPYGVGLGTKPNNQRSITEDRQYESFVDTEENVVTLIQSVMPLLISVAERVALTPGVKNMWHYPRPHHTGSFFYPAATGCNSWGFSCWQPILYYGKDPFGGQGSRPDSTLSTETSERNGHPCPKPIGQMVWMVERATREFETILDPFMGSGTTGVACIKTGRQFIGIEKEPKYFDIACQRIRRVWQEKRSEIKWEEPAKQTQLELVT